MKDNDKKNAAAAPEGEKKHDINKSVFQVGKELKKQREAELEAQQQEAVRLAAEREKKKREAYEKKLQDEKIALIRLKQGVIDENESEIHEEKEEEVKLSFGKKIANFFYHNKWWLGLGTFFACLAIFLGYDLMTKPRPDMVILMLCVNDDVGKSVYLDDFFSEYGEDSNGNGKVLVNVYYIPYGEDEYQNYINGVTNKLTNYLTNNEAVMIIGDKRTTDDLLTPDENFVDLSRLYPDNPHVKDYFFYVKGTKFAEQLGVDEYKIGDDMFFAIRKPQNLINASEKKMQETYDKDFPTFDRIIKALSEEEE